MPRIRMECIKVPPTLIGEIEKGCTYLINIGESSASLYLPDGSTWPFNVGSGTQWAFNLKNYFRKPTATRKVKRRKLNLKKRRML